MKKPRVRLFGMALLIMAGALFAAAPEGSSFVLREVARSSKQWTGVAVSKEGRIFVNFPRWQDGVQTSVAEVTMSGEIRPFPSAEWNLWAPELSPGDHFICVQSVYVDREDYLWILDPANPKFQGVVEGGAKLLKVDLKTNTVVQRILFDSKTAPKDSYLNDVRIDTKKQFAFLTDSGLGALVVVDLKQGVPHRILEGHASVKAEEMPVTIEGHEVKTKAHADGIALDPKADWLYYKPLAGKTLYRIPVKPLRDFLASEADLGGRIQTVAEVGPTDGMEFDADGNLYMTSIEHNALQRLTPKGKLETLVQDLSLKWPDSLAITPEGLLFVTISQIHLGPNPPEPYKIFVIKLK